MAPKSAMVGSTDATEPDTAVEDREGLLHSSREQEIRNRAFEIYLQRGGQFGYELCVCQFRHFRASQIVP